MSDLFFFVFFFTYTRIYGAPIRMRRLPRTGSCKRHCTRKAHVNACLSSTPCHVHMHTGRSVHRPCII